MSLGARDREALELIRSRSFAGAFVASLALELQARRLTLNVYGAVRANDRATYLGTLTAFGASELALDNAAGYFPEAVALAGFDIAYDEETDRGSATLRGARAWSLSWSFDGLAYEERATVLASLADEL